MKTKLYELEGKKIANINYFTYDLFTAQYFYTILVQIHSNNHLYVIKENMRYYIRGIVAYDDFDMKYERYQLALLANYCDCNSFNGYASNPERTDTDAESFNWV